jgi:hypothetical protein
MPESASPPSEQAKNISELEGLISEVERRLSQSAKGRGGVGNVEIHLSVSVVRVLVKLARVALNQYKRKFERDHNPG